MFSASSFLNCDAQGKVIITPFPGSDSFTEDATLTAETNSTTDPIRDGDGMRNATFTYTWKRVRCEDKDKGGPIPGATSRKYTLTQEDVGCEIEVAVKYEDDFENEETVSSEDNTQQQTKGDESKKVKNRNDDPTGS